MRGQERAEGDKDKAILSCRSNMQLICDFHHSNNEYFGQALNEM